MMAKQQRLHPHKFTLWLAIGSILMMFAGLTSAYIVKRNQANWTGFEIPRVFWYSTVVIIASSATIYFAQRSFKERLMGRYRSLMSATLVLGIAFVALQAWGFWQMWQEGQTLTASVSFSFLYVIVGLHAAHVIGGVIALIVMWLRAFRTRVKNYSIVPVELISTYWHFVDVLWVYLLVFLLMIK